MLKMLFYQFVSSKKQVRFTHMRGKHLVYINSKKTAILRGCNSLLRVIEKDSGISRIHVDFSTKEASSRLNGLFMDNGIRGMLEGKDYRNLDFVFPFVAAYIDRFIGCKKGILTKVNTMYSDIVHELFHTIETQGFTEGDADRLDSLIINFKTECKHVFSSNVENGLFTLKFHLLDHLVEDLRNFGSLDVLSASPYEYYNAVFKRHYRETSKRRATAMEETVNRLGTDDQHRSWCTTRTSTISTNSANYQHLVRDGFTVTLR